VLFNLGFQAEEDLIDLNSGLAKPPLLKIVEPLPMNPPREQFSIQRESACEKVYLQL
jgi:hypothetical protein